MAEKQQDNREKPAAAEGSKFGTSLSTQGWFGLAFWLSLGLLLEGLIGFRAPAYLQDATRRELFRLAHAHGAILSLLLLIAGLYLNKDLIAPPSHAIRALQVGAVLMPLGFLLGGIWHYESDPNPLIIAAPIGGLLIIFAVISIGFSIRKK